MRYKIEAAGHMIYTHNMRWHLLKKATNKFLSKVSLPTWQRNLVAIREKYGPGIKVCHIIVKMLKDGKAVEDARVVAVVGKKQGADSAAVFSVNPKGRHPVLEEVIVAQGA